MFLHVDRLELIPLPRVVAAFGRRDALRRFRALARARLGMLYGAERGLVVRLGIVGGRVRLAAVLAAVDVVTMVAATRRWTAIRSH